MDKDSEIEIDDAFLATAFQQQKDIISEVLPFLKSSHPPRVSFRIKGDIRTAMDRIAANVQVGIRDFIQSAKGLRNSIYLLKSTAQYSTKKEGVEQ